MIIKQRVFDLLEELKAKNIFVFLDGDDLSIQADENSMDNEMIQILKENKIEIVNYLKSNADVCRKQNEFAGLYPLSPMQEGMLFHSLYDPESEVYLTQLTCEINGLLDVELFKQAWQHIINQHTILRTSFVYKVINKALQRVHSKVDCPFEYLNYTNIKNKKQKEAIDKFLGEDRKKGFDFSQVPLMRLYLIETAKDKYHFVWTHHHIILDGWSIPIIFKELFLTYEKLSRRQDISVGQVDRYEKYIEYLSKRNKQKDEIYWKNYLKGFSSPNAIPFYKPEFIKNAGGNIYNKKSCELSLEMSGILQNLIKEQHLTANTIVQGVWALLMHYYTGEEDVMYGITVSGRPVEISTPIASSVESQILLSTCLKFG